MRAFVVPGNVKIMLTIEAVGSEPGRIIGSGLARLLDALHVEPDLRVLAAELLA